MEFLISYRSIENVHGSLERIWPNFGGHRGSDLLTCVWRGEGHNTFWTDEIALDKMEKKKLEALNNPFQR